MSDLNSTIYKDDQSECFKGGYPINLNQLNREVMSLASLSTEASTVPFDLKQYYPEHDVVDGYDVIGMAGKARYIVRRHCRRIEFYYTNLLQLYLEHEF